VGEEDQRVAEGAERAAVCNEIIVKAGGDEERGRRKAIRERKA
jgi:hypothetical protein